MSDAAPGAASDLPTTLMRWAGRLPLGVLRGLGAALGLLVYLAAPGYRRKLREHMAQAGYRRRSDAWRAALQAGGMVGEIPYVWSRPPQDLLSRVQTGDLKALEDAVRGGGGILVLTPHLGAFEVVGRFVAARSRFTVMFKPPKQAWLRPLFEFSRNVGSLDAVPASIGGVRAVLRALRSGGAVGVLPDQVPGGGDGRWVPFFGRPAYTMTLPERLAQQPGVRVVLAAGERLSGGRGWRIHFEAMDEPATPEAVNARMEALIRRWPTQYLWSYNRYKRPPSEEASGPPEARG